MNFFYKIFFLIIVLFLNTSLLDASKIDKKKILDSSASLELDDDKIVEEAKREGKERETSSKEKTDDTYEDIATYNVLANEMKKAKREKTDQAKEYKMLISNIDIYKKALAEKKAKEKLVTELSKKSKIINLMGYCSTRNTIKVDQIQGYGVLECVFDENDLHIDNSRLFATFVPLHNKLALIARPIYLEGINGKKIPVKNGVLLTIDRTSLNIASFVNDRKIKLMGGKLAKESSRYALALSADYLRQKKLSQQNEEVVYNTPTVGSPQTIVTKNTSPPEVKDYLVNFGIQFTSALIGVIGDAMMDNSYPLFEVYAGTQFYVDFQISYKKDENGIIDYKINEYQNIQEAKLKENKNTDVKQTYRNMSGIDSITDQTTLPVR